MTGKALCFWVRCAIIAIAICGVCVCAFWYPFCVFLTSITPQGIGKAVFWVQILFYWLTSLPCFWILIMGWRVTTAIKEERLFQEGTAKTVKNATQILFIDLAVFFIGNVLFLLLDWNRLAWIYFVFVIVGLVIGIFMAILSHYLYRAAELQEESEGTI